MLFPCCPIPAFPYAIKKQAAAKAKGKRTERKETNVTDIVSVTRLFRCFPLCSNVLLCFLFDVLLQIFGGWEQRGRREERKGTERQRSAPFRVLSLALSFSVFMSLCHFALSWFLLHKTSSIAFAIKSNNSLDTNLLSVGRTMSALSPVRITSWANASLVADDVCVTGMECKGCDAAAEAPVSAEPSLHVTVGADAQPDTSDERESEDEKQPPHTESDNPADGLQCYVEGCGRHYSSWKSLLNHLRNAHRKQQSSFREQLSMR